MVQVQLDDSFKLGSGCTESGTTLKFTKDGKETWVFVDAFPASQTGYRDSYALYIRAQAIRGYRRQRLLDKNKDG